LTKVFFQIFHCSVVTNCIFAKPLSPHGNKNSEDFVFIKRFTWKTAMNITVLSSALSQMMHSAN